MSEAREHFPADGHPELKEKAAPLITRVTDCRQTQPADIPFLDIVDFLPDATFVIDKDKKVIAWNRAIEEMTGVRKEDILGQGDYAYAVPFYGHRRPLLVDLIGMNESDIAEYKHVKRQGRTLYAEVFVPSVFQGRGGYLWVIAAPLLDSQGNQVGAIESIRDITERMRAEQALRESEDRFRSIIEQCPFSVQVLSPDGRVLHLNAAGERLWGVTQDALKDYNLLEDRQIKALGFMPIVRRAFAGERVSAPVVEYDASLTVVSTGNRKTVQGDFYPIRDADGTLRYVILLHQDVTERKQAEDALHRRSEELAALNRLIQEVNATLSVDGLIAAATSMIAHLAHSDLVLFFAREGDDLILKGECFLDSRRSREEIPLHHVGQCLCGIAVASGKPTYSDDVHIDSRCTMEECKRMGLTSLAAIPLRAGEAVMGVLALGWHARQNLRECAAFLETMAGQVAAACRNALLHEQVQRHATELERRVEERTAQLATANKELESFSYSVSHDLRGPVRRIDGFSQILAESCADKLDDAGKDCLIRVRTECRHMAQLIQDLLSLSRIARSELSRQTVDMTSLARQVVATLRETDPQRRVEVVIAEGLTVNADESLLQVVLENLLGNAWKFTRNQNPTHIELGVNHVNGQRVYFVRDNGAGFDMALAGRLFGAFQRLHSDTDFEGTGIGLATVQRIIHRHGGRVWAESQINHGATFFFTLS